MDSGAEAILLRQSTVEANNLQVSTGDPTRIIFANGQSTDTHQTVNIGEIEALVCPDKDLTEDLISINPLLDHGFNLTMERDEGMLHNPNTDAVIHVRREGKRWAIDLEDLSRAVKQSPELRDSPKVNQLVEAKAVITRTSKGIRDQVISLHERMGHPHVEAMCKAIEGDSPTWTHCDLTP